MDIRFEQPKRPYREMKITAYSANDEGFGDFYRDASGILIRRFIRLGERDTERLQDAVQDVFADLYSKLEEIRTDQPGCFSGAPVFGWLTQALNWRLSILSRNERNSKGVTRLVPLDNLLIGATVNFGQIDNAIEVRDILDKLPTRDQTVLERTMEGYSSSEIAAEIGVGEGQIRGIRRLTLKHARKVANGEELRSAGRPPKPKS